MKKTFILILLVLFVYGCTGSDEKSYWKKVGELSLHNEPLTITIPGEKDWEGISPRFYLASPDRETSGESGKGIMIALRDGDTLYIFEEENPGSFTKEILSADNYIFRDKERNNIRIKIPSEYLFEDELCMWSAYEKPVNVNDIILKRKTTFKISESDPYPYILIKKERS